MIRKRYSPEQIIGMLRETEGGLAQGMTVGQACCQLSISEQTYYRWRKQYSGLKISYAFESKTKCQRKRYADLHDFSISTVW